MGEDGADCSPDKVEFKYAEALSSAYFRISTLSRWVRSATTAEIVVSIGSIQ